MTNLPNYYRTLGVARNSEDVVIQAAYRALMRRYHPDTNKSATAQQKSIEINEAYAVLGNAEARKSYDRRYAEQKNEQRRRASDKAKSASPPPPPPPPQQNAPPPEANESPNPGLRAAGAVGFGLLALIVIFGAANNGDYSSNVVNVDENMMTTDVNSELAVDENLMTTDMNVSTDMNAVATSALPQDLSQQPATAVRFKTIENAAHWFAKTLNDSGVIGARETSEKCHAAVQEKPTWDGADKCAAFDYAAAYMDASMSASNGYPRSAYFSFVRGNQEDNYAAAGAPSYQVSARLAQIKQAAEQAVGEAIVDVIAKNRALRSKSVKERTDRDADDPALTPPQNEA